MMPLSTDFHFELTKKQDNKVSELEKTLTDVVSKVHILLLNVNEYFGNLACIKQDQAFNTP